MLVIRIVMMCIHVYFNIYRLVLMILCHTKRGFIGSQSMRSLKSEGLEKWMIVRHKKERSKEVAKKLCFDCKLKGSLMIWKKSMSKRLFLYFILLIPYLFLYILDSWTRSIMCYLLRKLWRWNRSYARDRNRLSA